jgi:hypothetical protein
MIIYKHKKMYISVYTYTHMYTYFIFIYDIHKIISIVVGKAFHKILAFISVKNFSRWKEVPQLATDHLLRTHQ